MIVVKCDGCGQTLTNDTNNNGEWVSKSGAYCEATDTGKHDPFEEERPEYTNPRYRQFVEDMEDAGYEWEHYNGRFSYEGPAVRTDERGRDGGPTMQEVTRATEVTCQWDNMALNYIVYPR